MLELSFSLVLHRPSPDKTGTVFHRLLITQQTLKRGNTSSHIRQPFPFFLQWNIMVKLRDEYESNGPFDHNIKEFFFFFSSF